MMADLSGVPSADPPTSASVSASESETDLETPLVTPAVFRPFAWLRQVNVPPTIPRSSGRPLCYEQMHKVRFEWWTMSLDEQGRVIQRGPYPSEYAARQFVASLG